MHERDFHPFTPDSWSADSDAPTWTGRPTLVLVSAQGTRIRAERERQDVLATSVPIWRLTDDRTDWPVGWVARNGDVLTDIQVALNLGTPRFGCEAAVEFWLLQQGLISGTWSYSQGRGALHDQERSVPVPSCLTSGLEAMACMARVSKHPTHDHWFMMSGPNALQITLPTTRHGAMERLAALQSSENEHA